MTAQAIVQLNAELAEMRKFVALLNAERQSLLDNDTEALLNLSESKARAANQLQEISNTRRKKLLTAETDTMETWLSRHAPASLPLWQQIRDLANEAQQINHINGELIQSRMRNNQQTLGVLFNSSPSAAGVYGKDGQANINSSGRHLGSG